MSYLLFLQLNIFLPVFLLGGGGVLLVNGLTIYHYYQAQNNATILFYCTDIYRSASSALSALTGFLPPDIHGAENYVSIEFAGVIVALGFYVSCVKSVFLWFDGSTV